MAIGRKVFGPRKVVIAFQVGEGTYADPAIDVSASDVHAYKETLFDTSHIKFVSGMEPTWFTVQPLTRRQKDATDAMSIRERASWIIKFGLVSVDNYLVDGQPLECPERKTHGGYGLCLPDSFLDRMDLASEYLYALANMIWHLSEAQGPT